MSAETPDRRYQIRAMIGEASRSVTGVSPTILNVHMHTEEHSLGTFNCTRTDEL